MLPPSGHCDERNFPNDIRNTELNKLMPKYLLEMQHITKLFPGVKALDEVDLQVEDGEIHALVGENGAGKSTLMNVLSGTYPYGTYTGNIIFDGQECKFRNIKDSEKIGIVIIHQELALIPYLSVAENMFLGNERATKGVIDWGETEHQARELLERVGLESLDPNLLIKDIGVGKQQLVEIAKAIAKRVRLLILDEPTAALNDNDSDHLLALLLELKAQGITSIIISHKLSEVERIADSITIIRDGACIETLIKGKDEISENRIIHGMVGRDITDRFPSREPKIGDMALEVEHWNVFDPQDEARQIIFDAGIKVHKGEVVGIAGLMGAGRTEFAMSVFGKAYGTRITGEVKINGKPTDVSTIQKAIQSGLAYSTEDRKAQGLILIDTIKSNITLASPEKISEHGVIDHHKALQDAEEYRERMNIKSPSVHQITGNLSGGNQQKVMLSRWIYANPDILILDEPTRGIDVGAKYEIYTIINDLVANDKAVVMISSEMPELLGMCDRVYVMNEGRIVGELSREDATQNNIMRIILQSGRQQGGTENE